MRPLLSALIACAGIAACDSRPNDLALLPVESGTISGVSFTVTGGTVYQGSRDGPLYADAGGGQIVLDDDPAALGMTDPDLLQLRTRFAISDGGSLRIAAFGSAGSEFNTGVSTALLRLGRALYYEFRLSGALFADDAFAPQPALPAAEHWIVTEFYADSLPGYPAGESGATMWGIDDLTPEANEDLLACDPGPAADPMPLAGDRVGYALDGAWLLAVEVVDQIVGPCV